MTPFAKKAARPADRGIRQGASPSSAERRNSGWTISPTTVITQTGTSVGDLQWDFRSDHESGGLFPWDVEIRIGDRLIGRLGQPSYRPLLTALQQSVAVRWKYARRDRKSTRLNSSH